VGSAAFCSALRNRNHGHETPPAFNQTSHGNDHRQLLVLSKAERLEKRNKLNKKIVEYGGKPRFLNSWEKRPRTDFHRCVDSEEHPGWTEDSDEVWEYHNLKTGEIRRDEKPDTPERHHILQEALIRHLLKERSSSQVSTNPLGDQQRGHAKCEDRQINRRKA